MAQVFATVNIVDSQHAKALTETASLDSRAMKRVNFRPHVSLLYTHTIFTDILVSAFRCHPKNLAPQKTLLSLSLCSLTMVFLPASFAAVRPSYPTFVRHSHVIWQAVFGMNVTEINSGSKVNLARYVQLALPLTAVTIWIIISLQGRAHLDDPEPSMWSQMWWPVKEVTAAFTCFSQARGRRRARASKTRTSVGIV